ncbi:MAG: sodium:proton antiporter [Alphaproteobacteria bacterium]|nr:sodium:proton antiporter [Alphaproteobacteria bacterium]
MSTVFDVIALLLGLAALFGYVNQRWFRLPPSIGVVIIALAASLAVLGLDAIMPVWGLGTALRTLVAGIDFSDTLMKGMLSFLLFAGALHVDLGDLRERRYAIAAMATIGLLLSTLLVGLGMWGVFALLGLGVPLLMCLVFGALISPTDPIAVLGILKSVTVPRTLEAKIAGESLFNDGVAVVVFTILVALATTAGPIGAGDVVLLFVEEAVGGVVLGLAAGSLAFVALRSIDEYTVEVMITLALVSVTYALAGALHTSGPIAVVVAGLLIGNHGRRLAMSETTRHHLTNFWKLLDEILNAVLFLLIGLEVVAVSFSTAPALAAALAVPVALAARLAGVALPLTLLGLKRSFTPGAVPILTWGGLRGGISVALALSLPEGPWKEVLLSACYGVVVFSIIVQGLTIERLVKRLLPEQTND